VTHLVPLVEIAAWARTVESLDQVDWTIRVGEKNPFVKLAATVVAPLLGLKTRTFSTIEEALAFLEEDYQAMRQGNGGYHG
jgi:hypothetical protein